MKHIHYLYIGALAFLIACNSEERITTTNGNDRSSDAIELSAGIVEGNAKATTRAVAEANHANHHTFSEGTKIALRVSGTWTGHTPSPEIVETTTASLSGVATGTDNRHNKLSSSPVLYWEDYGSSDIANMGPGKGREEGLTIYGATVNGKSLENAGLGALLNTETNWDALSWTLPTDQRPTGSLPADKDLLISNNVKTGTDDGTYKFDEHNNGKLLEFKHAMSKITVNLKPGAGFSGDFTSEPVVELTSKDGTAATVSATEWALTKGKVNVSNGNVNISSEEGQGVPAVITMAQASLSSTAQTNGYTKAREALVMPGSAFTADDAIILKINADDNIYYVTAGTIRAAITETSKVTQAGKNYIINVIINETDISVNVTATITDWIDVVATEVVAPVINVNASIGTGSGTLDKAYFSFYRSTNLNANYGVKDVYTNYYAEDRRVKYQSSTWTMGAMNGDWGEEPLYWPNHITHYQFRGVWPETGTATGSVNYPRVEAGSGSTNGCQVIKVSNVAYSENTFPSDLMIGRPEIDPSTLCTNNDHTKVSLYDVGICATEGTINLNFRYMMSKVKVNLTTSKEGDQDYPATVNLNNAKVEIVNVHKTGDVKLGDREVIPTGVISATPDPANDTFGSYTLGNYTYNGETKTATYSSAIVPQTFAYTSPLANGNAKFRITIYKDGNTNNIDDIYEADLQPILVQEGTSAAAAVDGWKSGKYYVYNLRLTKTKVQVTASLTPWTEVTATQDIWF